jgi:hypothetical protein
MTTNLPPLPLVDDCLFVDNAFMEHLVCLRYTQYAELHRRVAASQRPGLVFGSAQHLALESRYRRCGSAAPDLLQESDIAVELAAFFQRSENVPPEDDWRNANWAVEVFKRYNQAYQVEPFNLLTNEANEPMVELSFVLELFVHNGIRIMYCGKIDLPVLWDNQLIVIDHKTTSVLGDYFFKDQRVSPQLVGYCWAFEKLTRRTVNGFCVNAIRSRQPPAKPVGGLDRWWAEGFARHKEYIFPHTTEEWHRNTIDLLEEFFWHYERGFMPQRKKWCVAKYGDCPFYGVCDLPPSQRGVLLESSLFVDNDWTPLKSPSQSLQ